MTKQTLANTNQARQTAFFILREVNQGGAFADTALDKWLKKINLNDLDRRLTTEIVYGCVRRRRSLDSIINQLAKKTADQQHPDIRTILHIGLYQLCFMPHIPESAVVNTTVELTKQNQLKNLAGVVNGILRQYLRQQEANSQSDNHPLSLLKLSPDQIATNLGILNSFPDWLITFWLETIGATETEKLCTWFNQNPTIDLRINPLKTDLNTVKEALQSQNINVQTIPYLPQCLRLTGSVGAIAQLPGYQAGWWSVQDSSAQLVSHLLDPQPGETIIDACAAPGGKTCHIAELMGDTGKIIAIDSIASRLKKLQQNIERLQLKSIEIVTADSRKLIDLQAQADRVLLDTPCSGLGTLHRRVDARWRQTPENITTLAQLQKELLNTAATWVKPGGILVYATCTIHPQENEQVITGFLNQHSQWQITPITDNINKNCVLTPEATGWLKIWPHEQNMDGFFVARLQHLS
jgi:16S rRNA (cytosine967-C5)-methyltransferase